MNAIATLEERLHVTGHRGDTRDARCPAHEDHSASLVFSPGENGGVVLHCHAGCEPKDVLAAINMSLKDLSPDPHLVEVYAYLDERGEKLWEVERWEPKDFRCRPGLPSVHERRLYHSELLIAARAHGATVYVVEGEKDANTLVKLGEIAVCAVGGAGKWLPKYSEQLRGLDVVVIADNDDPGRAHGRAVARALDGQARKTTLTSPSYGKDVTDQISAGYDLDTLVALSVDENLGVHRADRIIERQIQWLWEGYLPQGKMVILEGDPGDGKSVMTCDLAARFSTGSKLPDGSVPLGGPIDVAMISAEDDPEDTIRPRLRIAGANLRRIHLITEGTIPGNPFDIGRDIPALEAFVTENHIGLIVIDPLMAFMPANLNAYSDHEVRRAIHPLTRMAMRTGCTLVVVRHLTKGRTKAITAGGGSIAFIGAARVGYLIGPHPDDESKRAMSCVKINIGQMPATLGYRVISDPVSPHIPRVVWDDDPLDVSAQEILDGDEEDGRSARDDAREFLHELLCENHSGMKWEDVLRTANKEGHSKSTLERIRKSVAHQIRNPTKADGTQLRGTYWFVNFVDGSHKAKVEDSVPLVVEDFVPEPEFAAPLFGPCDVCGEDKAVSFGEPHNVRRCSSHNPMFYTA